VHVLRRRIPSQEQQRHRGRSGAGGVLSVNILRTVHNYILTGKDGKTPAQRLGLAQAPLDYADIIYFSRGSAHLPQSSTD
jgi:hypothetical protein